jgi:hypothetical protein
MDRIIALEKLKGTVYKFIVDPDYYLTSSHIYV